MGTHTIEDGIVESTPFDPAHVVVLALADDRGAHQAVRGLQQDLHVPDDHLRSLSLENVTAAAAAHEPDLQACAEKFNERYLHLPTQPQADGD